MAGNGYPAGFLQDFLLNNYDQSAVEILCQDLGISYDSLPGKRKDKKVRELVRRLERCSRLNDLASQLKKNPIFLQEEKKFRQSVIPYSTRLRTSKLYRQLTRDPIIKGIFTCIGAVIVAITTLLVEELVIRPSLSPTATLQNPTPVVYESSTTTTIAPTLILSPSSSSSSTATLSKDSTPTPSFTFTSTPSPSVTPTPFQVSPIPLRELSQLCNQENLGCKIDPGGKGTGAVSPDCSFSNEPGVVEFSWHNVQESQDYVVFTFSLLNDISPNLVEAAERNTHLVMWVLGEKGQERFIVKLLDRDGNKEEYTAHASEEWQQKKIPLRIFSSQGVNVTQLESLGIAFEHFSDVGLESKEGRICIGEIGFGSP